MSKTAADLAQALRSDFSGEAVLPGDGQYDEVRKIHNGLIDKRPALIARCNTSGDVSSAVNLAREEGLEVSVRGGGHNVAGKAVTDGGVMIDLSPMKAVDVDPKARTARSGAGVIWREYNDATAGHGLASTGGVISTTGVAGLTLGGGIGWLMGKEGLAIDRLVEVEVVLASGDIVTASESADPDLFWAIRGGGGNFGAVTSFTFAVNPLDTVVGGIAAHPLDRAPEFFRFYREFASDMPDELVCAIALVHAPDGSGTKICGNVICHCGDDPDRAAADVKPLRTFGPPILDMVDRMPYPIVNTLLDDSSPRGALNYWKSAFFSDLSDEAVAIMVDAFQNCPTTMCGLFVEHIHGAVTRVAPTATAFPHRSGGYNVLVISQWTDPSQTDEGIAWARGTYDRLRPFLADGAYVNYLAADEADRVRAAYGPNYDRLVELKRRYDPDNLFRLNQNINPSR
jgi:FAD/FMN-containing dehydrogenase